MKITFSFSDWSFGRGIQHIHFLLLFLFFALFLLLFFPFFPLSLFFLFFFLLLFLLQLRLRRRLPLFLPLLLLLPLRLSFFLLPPPFFLNFFFPPCRFFSFIFFSFKNSGPSNHKVESFNSKILQPLLAKSAGFCFDGTYCHVALSVISLMLVTLMLTKLFNLLALVFVHMMIVSLSEK